MLRNSWSQVSYYEVVLTPPRVPCFVEVLPKLSLFGIDDVNNDGPDTVEPQEDQLAAVSLKRFRV
jgi:hypothetical protein